MPLFQYFVRKRSDAIGAIISDEFNDRVQEIMDKVRNPEFVVHLTCNPDAHVIIGRSFASKRFIIHTNDEGILEKMLEAIVDHVVLPQDYPDVAKGLYDPSNDRVRRLK